MPNLVSARKFSPSAFQTLEALIPAFIPASNFSLGSSVVWADVNVAAKILAINKYVILSFIVNCEIF